MVGTNQEMPYNMSETGIVWPGEKDKYKVSKYTADQVIPPPLWRTRDSNSGAPYSFSNNYTAENLFNPSNDEHFMVWMRTAGLPTFRKLYKRQDSQTMEAGRYRIVIHDSEYGILLNLRDSIGSMYWRLSRREISLGADNFRIPFSPSNPSVTSRLSGDKFPWN